MIPAKTMKAIHSSLHQCFQNEPGEHYAILGNDLNELRALAIRLGRATKLEPGEARDWENRLNLLCDTAFGPLTSL